VVNSEIENQDRELDVPLETAVYPATLTSESKTAFNIERHKAEQEAKTNEHAFGLAVFCLCIIIAIFLNDIISSYVQKHYITEITEKTFEITKTILLIVIGYLFGKKN